MAASRMTFSWEGGSAEIGKQLTVNITRDSQSYRHHLVVQFNGVIVTELYGITNMTVYTPSLSEYGPKIPNNTQGTLNIICYTYNGSAQLGNMGTYVGSTSKSVTIRLSDSVVPTLSNFTLSDASGYLSEYGAYVATKSFLEATINGSAVYGASIEQYKISVGSSYATNKLSSTVTIYDLNTTGTINATATITDTRGRYSQSKKQITVVPYSNPSLLGTNVKRWNSSTGTEDDESSTVRINVVGSICNVNSKSLNTGTAKIETATYGSESWTTRDARSVGTSSFDYNYDVSGMSANTKYQVRVTVTDSFGTETSSILTVDTALPVIDFKSNGKGIALFSVANNDGLEVNSDAKINGDFNLTNGSVFYNPSKEYIASFNINGGQTGWIKVCEITNASGATYSNSGISMKITQRNRFASILTFYCTNQNNNNLTVSNACVYGTADVALTYKANTCSIWVQKSESYDVICIGDLFVDPVYMSRLSFAYPGDYASLSQGLPGTAINARNISLGDLYPVGSVVIRYDHTSPASIYGGTWTRISGAFLYATGSTGTIGATGGSGTHTLTVAQMPSHRHNFKIPVSTIWNANGGTAFQLDSTPDSLPTYDSSNSNYVQAAGSGQAHNNNPYFINVSVWRRTA